MDGTLHPFQIMWIDMGYSWYWINYRASDDNWLFAKTPALESIFIAFRSWTSPGAKTQRDDVTLSACTYDNANQKLQNRITICGSWSNSLPMAKWLSYWSAVIHDSRHCIVLVKQMLTISAEIMRTDFKRAPVFEMAVLHKIFPVTFIDIQWWWYEY